MRELPQYVPILGTSLKGLSTKSSMDFVGPLQRQEEGKRYILLCKKIKARWLIASSIYDATEPTTSRFIAEEIIYQ